jgi:hypothetical protein
VRWRLIDLVQRLSDEFGVSLDETTVGRHLKPKMKIELWFQDEARIGQKNKITRRWARRGTRPRAPHDLQQAQECTSRRHSLRQNRRQLPRLRPTRLNQNLATLCQQGLVFAPQSGAGGLARALVELHRSR